MAKYLIAILMVLVAPMGVRAADYEIVNFASRIEVLKNTDLRITEMIEADFNVPKHGIFR